MSAPRWAWAGLGLVALPWVVLASGCALLPCCRLPLLGDRGREWAGEIKGPVERVVSGDTIIVAGQTVQLFGIDAPEIGQPCHSPEGRVPCGVWAMSRLTLLVHGRGVECEVRDRDRSDRFVAVCRAGAEDLGQAMVDEGLARAYRSESLDYADEEEQARAAQRGMWAYGAPPLDWRAR